MSHPKNSTRLQIHMQCTLFGMFILYSPNLNRQFGYLEYENKKMLESLVAAFYGCFFIIEN